jgi:hypothetical protein
MDQKMVDAVVDAAVMEVVEARADVENNLLVKQISNKKAPFGVFLYFPF